MRLGRGIAKAAAQARDARIHSAVQPVELDTAQLLEDVVAAEHGARGARQDQQQVELGRLQVDRLAAPGDGAIGRRDGELTKDERVVVGRGRFDMVGKARRSSARARATSRRGSMGLST